MGATLEVSNKMDSQPTIRNCHEVVKRFACIEFSIIFHFSEVFKEHSFVFPFMSLLV